MKKRYFIQLTPAGTHAVYDRQTGMVVAWFFARAWARRVCQWMNAWEHDS